MLKNYLKIAVRNIRKNPGYSFINIFGLTIGLACCLMIFQYVVFEYSFDRFHEKEDQLYRVTTGIASSGETLRAGGAFTAQAMAPALEEAIPEISQTTRIHPEYQPPLVSNPEHPGKVFEEQQVFHTDPAFMQMFSFPLVAGSREDALRPGTMLISETMARKYFKDQDPIGQTLKVAGIIERNYRVMGVFEDVPANSHLQFEMLLALEDLLRSEQYVNEPEGGWSWNNFLTYVQLHPSADVEDVNRKMTDVLISNRAEILNQRELRAIVKAQPLGDVHLNANVEAPAGEISSYRTVNFFIIIALLTLLIALVNYVNLATARSVDRAREVGVRKVVGALRGQLMKQFFFESALINLVAILLAVATTEVIRPLISDMAGVQITGFVWWDPWLWMAIVAAFLVSTLLAGLYPAMALSSFKPVSVLKGKGGTLSAKQWLRRGLVVFQFVVAVILIGGTIVIYNQLNFMQNRELGLNMDRVLNVNAPRLIPEDTDRATSMATFTQELRRLPEVREVAISASLPGQGFNWHGASIRRAEENPSAEIRGVVTYIDTSFASLYGLDLIAGEGFDAGTKPAGTEEPWAVIANETAIESLGFSTAEEAVNHSLVLGDYEARIVGVFRDFDWTSAHESRENILFGYTRTGRNVSLRIDSGDWPGTIAEIESIYSQLFPGNYFSYAFVDEAFDAQYRNDQQFASLFSLFASLAIAIACLGLFGLTSFTIQQRTKEIGIRKILGASVPRLVATLSGEFFKLVAFSVFVGLAATYLIMNRWLADYAYRIDIGAEIFLISGGVAFLIALATVSLQSMRSAMATPVDSLRSE